MNRPPTSTTSVARVVLGALLVAAAACADQERVSEPLRPGAARLSTAAVGAGPVLDCPPMPDVTKRTDLPGNRADRNRNGVVCEVGMPLPPQALARMQHKPPTQLIDDIVLPAPLPPRPQGAP